MTAEPEVLDDRPQLIKIAGRQVTARQDIDPRGIPPHRVRRFFDQDLDNPRDGLIPAVLERILEVGGRDIDDREFRELADGSAESA